MRTLRFYKNELGWFIDLKWFPFDNSWLSMVAGADELLDKLSGGLEEVILDVSTSPIKYGDGWLEKRGSVLLGGAFYEAKGINIDNDFGEGTKSQLWLCPATLWVFLKYPKKLYYRKKVRTETVVNESNVSLNLNLI